MGQPSSVLCGFCKDKSLKARLNVDKKIVPVEHPVEEFRKEPEGGEANEEKTPHRCTFDVKKVRDETNAKGIFLTLEPRRYIASDSTELVGDTPMVYLDKMAQGAVARIAAKIEYFNPTCSVKDRAAFSMITQAERKGILKPGKSILIECTSGNMGVAMAQIAAVRGYKIILLMPATSSVERRAMMRAYGAELILLDPKIGIKGGVQKAYELAVSIPNSVVLDQFVNPANPTVHYQSTGSEIWEQTNGEVDVFVCGVGTGGTLTGAGSYLQEMNPKIQIFAVEPEEAPVISGEPVKGPHLMQGIGTGMLPGTLDTRIITEAVKVNSDEALTAARRLAAEEGLSVGISSGAAMAAAMKLARRPEMKGKLIVTLFPDFGERYLSTRLYQEVLDEVRNQKISNFEEDVTKYVELFTEKTS